MTVKEELNKEWEKCEPKDEGMGLEIANIEHEQFDNIAMHFYNLGLKEKNPGWKPTQEQLNALEKTINGYIGSVERKTLLEELFEQLKILYHAV